ncbi:hypothetical protein GCM10010169_23460 [Micromonospora fulviviridis]|uniref:hypothetical protein n=1 Tax=Micromonospora fulviviridis TaxID=47860 RepID=UPI001665F782|nr:hypothetical protein [Micromonospora fulviviridis]GGR78583.1 hypothetical protein GCM10010169_23460 [Micromonospora fulviviridis]
MHPLTEGVTVVVTPSARWVGSAVRSGASLAQFADQLAARDARKAAARQARDEPTH